MSITKLKWKWQWQSSRVNDLAHQTVPHNQPCHLPGHDRTAVRSPARTVSERAKHALTGRVITGMLTPRPTNRDTKG